MHKRILNLLLITAAVLVLIISAGRVSAQGEVRFSELEVDLWPEYDQPSMLVIYRAILAPEVSLPAEVTFTIPAAAGEPSAVAVGATLDTVADVEYDTQVNGSMVQVSFIAALPAIQFEYYDPALQIENDRRSYTYTWPGRYAVDSLVIQVQQPVDAGEMNISPALDQGAVGLDGLTYYNKRIGSLSANEPFTIRLNYQKSTDTLSSRSLPIGPSAPISSSNNLRSGLMAALPWLLGFLGVVLIVGGGWWYWQSGKGQPRPQTQRRRKAAPAREAASAEGHIYCHNCGKRAGPGDRFCRACGTKLRTE